MAMSILWKKIPWLTSTYSLKFECSLCDGWRLLFYHDYTCILVGRLSRLDLDIRGKKLRFVIVQYLGVSQTSSILWRHGIQCGDGGNGSFYRHGWPKQLKKFAEALYFGNMTMASQLLSSGKTLTHNDKGIKWCWALKPVALYGVSRQSKITYYIQSFC